MNLFKTLSPSSTRFREIEFTLLLGWALLYPAKIGYAYYLGFMCLLALFTLTNIIALKNVVFDRLALFLLAFNAIFVFSSFFSPHPIKSLFFTADVLLVSLWSVFFFLEKEDMGRYLRLAAYVISLSSMAVIIAFALQGGRLPVTAVFRNPILQGIASALAVLIFLHALLRHHQRADLFLLALNAGAVALAGSKAAYLGLVVFAAAMVFKHKRQWLFYLAGLLLLLAVFPNPVRRTVAHSLRHDPYVFDRLDIWNMSARMFRSRPWVGVGPDLFAEAARRFNFAQDKGPSRYGKVPESAHSDYWQIITENGLPGLVFVLLFLFFAIRHLLSPPRSDPAKLLLAFLLTQMLLFNLLFQFFFLFLFFFLLRGFFSSNRSFIALRSGSRVFFSATLVFMLIVLYLLPFIADRCLAAAARDRDLVSRYALLQKAALFSPLDERAPLAKAELQRDFARSRSDPVAWTHALDNARLAQRLNRNSTDALVLEAELFHDVRVLGHYYPAQTEEILAPLRQAGKLAPFSPFLIMRQAIILREFGRHAEARARAQAALDLEPDFVAAIVLIHELDGLPAGDPALRQRLASIRAKAERLRARPGSYLFNLHRLPAGARGQ
jgi:O-antigen ligase